MSGDKLGLGIIGCGQISHWHLQAGQQDGRARWVAACDVRAEAVAERADEFDIAGRYTQVEDLLADPAVDAVVVATGPEAHVGPTVAAFEAGKHALVEKPVAIAAYDVQAMLAAQGDLVGACCSSRFRSTDAARAATALIGARELGPVRRLVCQVLQPPPDQYDGTSPFYLHRPNWGGQGVLADWSCYDFDYMLGLCGWAHEPELVMAELSGVPEHFRAIAEPVNDVEVRVGAQVRMSHEVTLHYQRAMFAAVEEARGQWRIECENGALDLKMVPGTPQASATRFGEPARTLVNGPFEWGEIHQGPVTNFIDAIVDGATPMTTLSNALTVQRLTDAIYASARAGQAVTAGE